MNKHKDFNNRVAGYLAKVGTRLPDSSFGTQMFSLKTKVGELLVTLDTVRDFNGRSSKAVISLYGRFIDPDRAKHLVDCNPYSGKWNWHWYAHDNTVEYFLNIVMWDINEILEAKDLTDKIQ